jgi:hypothetical protein
VKALLEKDKSQNSGIIVCKQSGCFIFFPFLALQVTCDFREIITVNWLVKKMRGQAWRFFVLGKHNILRFS